MPVVRAIANAPQNGAQNVGTAGPSTDRTQKSEKAQGRSRYDRDKRTGGRYDNDQQGHGRPPDNDKADVSAACTGRAVVTSDMPSSSCAWSVRASFDMRGRATCRASC